MFSVKQCLHFLCSRKLIKMSWTVLSPIKKVKYNNNGKTIEIKFRRGNNPDLILRMRYASVLIIENLVRMYPDQGIDLLQPNEVRIVRLTEGNGFRYKKMKLSGQEIWTSPYFNIDEMRVLLEFVRTLPPTDISPYTALVMD